MRILNRADVARALTHAQCVDALAAPMRAVSDGRAIMPLRQYIDIPGSNGKFTMMPGYVDAPRTFGFKAIAKYPRAAGSPHGSHVGAVMLFDADAGVPIALLDGAEITAIRTAAASALATRLLAREDSRTLAVLGNGTQARHHISAMQAVRPIRNIRIWGRNEANATRLLGRLQLTGAVQAAVTTDLDEAVRDADIVCTTTAATAPFLSARQLPAGCHLNLVGAAVIEAAEVHADVVARSRFFVDSRESAMAQAGELANAIRAGLVDETHIAGEIGEVLLGRVDGRQDAQQITAYKSLGVAAQDLAAAAAALENAGGLSIGTRVDWR
ncbi:MAG: ornithine cyclodeaminase family protein [Pseudomonadota bacterium]